MSEIWKDIPNYEGLYQVSNLGRVKSLGNNNEKKQKIRKSHCDCKGYLSIALHHNKKRKQFKIHQLIAMAFLNHVPCRYKLIIDHINNNRLDNRVENLQIVTARENCSKDKVNKSSEYTGVTWSKKSNKWLSSIRIGSKRKHLGSFSNEYDAHLAYQKALSEL
jgi:hypothetical protein